MKTQVGITKIYKEEIESEDSLISLCGELIGETWGDDNYVQPIKIEKGKKESWAGECSPILIDSVIKILEDFKNRGANYIEIKFHGDHDNYVFNGIDIHKSTSTELKEYEDKIKAKEEQAKQKRIKILEEELNKLTKHE